MIFYWLPMLVVRILSTYLAAQCLKPHVMLLISLVLCLLIYCVWIYFLWHVTLTRLTIYLLVTGNGFSISTISPTVIGWIRQFLSLTPIELTLILISNAFGGIVFSHIAGYILKNHDYNHLFTLLMITVFFCLLFFVLALLYQRCHTKTSTTKQSIDQDRTLERFIPHDVRS